MAVPPLQKTLYLIANYFDVPFQSLLDDDTTTLSSISNPYVYRSYELESTSETNTEGQLTFNRPLPQDKETPIKDRSIVYQKSNERFLVPIEILDLKVEGVPHSDPIIKLLTLRERLNTIDREQLNHTIEAIAEDYFWKSKDYNVNFNDEDL